MFKSVKITYQTSYFYRCLLLAGETLFNFDTVYQLEQHSAGEKSTYGYYFTENYWPDPPNPAWTAPRWLKTKADHSDELAFVFGGTFIKTGKVKLDKLWHSECFLSLHTFIYHCYPTLLITTHVEHKLFQKLATENKQSLSNLQEKLFIGINVREIQLKTTLEKGEYGKKSAL